MSRTVARTGRTLRVQRRRRVSAFSFILVHLRKYRFVNHDPRSRAAVVLFLWCIEAMCSGIYCKAMNELLDGIVFEFLEPITRLGLKHGDETAGASCINSSCAWVELDNIRARRKRQMS